MLRYRDSATPLNWTMTAWSSSSTSTTKQNRIYQFFHYLIQWRFNQRRLQFLSHILLATDLQCHVFFLLTEGRGLVNSYRLAHCSADHAIPARLFLPAGMGVMDFCGWFVDWEGPIAWYTSEGVLLSQTEICKQSTHTTSCLYLLLDRPNKKLSCCCDSRSYCVQYFNAIHCEHNMSTSE